MEASGNPLICVVEHHPFMARLIKTLLDRLGYRRSVFFERAGDLLDWGKAASIDLLLLDERLSDASGLEIASAVRQKASPLARDLPIILCTHVDDPEFVFQARDRGVTEICLKPIQVANLYKKLRVSLEQPRSFVTSEEYVGPDRRRRSANYLGPERRSDRMEQDAVDRIMKS